MSIKEVSGTRPLGSEPAPQDRKGPGTQSTNDQRPLPDQQVRPDLDVSVVGPQSRVPEDLRKVNDVIEATNLAGEAVGRISRMLSGMEDLVGRVVNDDLTPAKVSAITLEARKLSAEIAETATFETSSGSKPLSGDTIRLELEQTLGKTLEIVLSSGAQSSFGLQGTTFTTRELILDTAAKVESARKEVVELKGKISAALQAIQRTVSQLDTLPEVGKDRLRDEDSVLNVARGTRGEIRERPRTALALLGDIKRRAYDLLF